MSTSITSIHLHERLLAFASNAIDFIENQPQRMAVRMLSSAFIKSSTTAALHYACAQSARGKSDFTSQLQRCVAQLTSTKATLEILVKRHYIQTDTALQLLEECMELEKIFKASVRTASRNQRKAAA